MTDLVIRNARLVATVDADRRELPGGWVAITGNLVEAVGTGHPPEAAITVDATDCLVTPGLINAHHHLYQNLTRAYPPMTDKPLFGWLQSLYPLWRAIDEDSVYASTFVGLAELALSGCTTSSDHLYLHPHGAGDLLAAEITAARDLGMRFHPTRGSMSLSEKDGGLPPDDVVADDDEILAASEDAVARHHDRSHGAMTRIALAPCSPFSVTERLMVASAELAERLDVRLHTHFAENAEDDEFSLATFGCRPMEYLERTGWCTDRTWVAHCVMPDDAEQRRLGAAGVGVAHCPSSNLILSSGISPIVPMRGYGVKVGLGVDFADAPEYVSNNDQGTANMLSAMFANGFAGRLVLASSMVVYGEGRYECPLHGIVRPGPRTPENLEHGEYEPLCDQCSAALEPVLVPEDAPLDPRNVYAATKLHQEHLAEAWARESGATVTSLRYHNVYGPRMPRDTPYAGVMSIFASSLAAGERPKVFEDGAQRRDFVHVSDVARANVLALTTDAPHHGALNVASGSPTTLLEAATILSRAAASQSDRAEHLDPEVVGGYRLGDVRHVVADPARARSAIGFTAAVGPAEGLASFATDPLRDPPGR